MNAKIVKLFWFYRAIMLIGLFAFSGCEKEDKNPSVKEDMVPKTVRTANPNASAEAKAVLQYFVSLPNRQENRVISGQQISTPKNYESMVKALYDSTGMWPAMLGGDYIGITPENMNYSERNQFFIDYFKSGGLLKISWHSNNPFNDEDTWNTDDVNLIELLTPGTNVNKKWMAQLDIIAAALTQLRDSGVVVIWGPFHEMNGGWFWWGGRDQAEFVRLWRHMFDYFTNDKGLDNLLWLFPPNSTYGNGIKPVDYYYPGNEYVDIVGLSVYDDGVEAGGYDLLLATGKPFGFDEFGPSTHSDGGPAFAWKGRWSNMTLINSIRDRYPKTSFVLYWSSWTGAKVGIVDNRNAREFMKDPWIISREDNNW